MKTVLVVDDEEKICWAFEQFLKDEGYRPLIANNAEEGLRVIESEQPDIVILDVRLPGMDGLEALQRIKTFNPNIHVIIMTAHDTFEATIQAMQRDAFDFVPKPLDLDEIKEILDRATTAQELSKKLSVPEIEPAEKYRIDKLVGKSPQIQQIYKLIGAMTTNNVTVLIEGEVGIGKGLVARTIHYNSPRKDKPFVPINCGALPDTLLESELFGYEKGAFTGATDPKPGKFELADGGTLFLDEVSAMSPALQVKLLRVLEEFTFERLGGTKTITADVRIIAATNENLATLVQTGNFREDLYYRLKVITFNLPPLRERKEDIPLLVRHFLHTANIEFGKKLKGLDDKAMELLLQYDWPGNVRELKHAIESAAILSRADVILPEHLPAEVIAGPRRMPRGATALESALESALNAYIKHILFAHDSTRKETHIDNKQGKIHLYDEILRIADKSIISFVLQKVNGNQVKTAQLLGISRTTLRKRINELGI